jgi:protein-disulfide isomerase
MRARQPGSGARLLVPLVMFALAAAWACGGSSSPTSPSPTPSQPVTLPSLDSMLADKVLGSADAPITMIEYSSLACPHCADFHGSTLPLIKSNYIDPGKVKLIYRDYAFFTSGVDLSAAMVARCSGDRFFTAIDLLYRSQGTWAGSSNATSALKTVVASIGMTGAEVDACLALTDLRNGIQAIRSKGYADYGISGTPTFIIVNNGQTVPGAYPYGTFDAIFKGLL